MHSFLEIYQKTLFILILMAILIAFATPVGTKIRQSMDDGIKQTMEIVNQETMIALAN